MLEVDDSNEPERRDDEHERWRAMQSAYAEYRRASEVLECASRSEDDSAAGNDLRLSILEGQQRVAFERYLEARLEFLEFQFDERSWPDAGVAAPHKSDTEHSRVRSWLAFARWLPVAQAVLLLCTIAFSLIRERKHVRDLEAARNELRTTLNQTRDGLQLHHQKLDTPHPSPIPQDERNQPQPTLASRGPAATLQAVRQKPSVEVQWRQQATLRGQPKQISAKRGPVPRTWSQRSGVRSYFSLPLAHSRQYKRVGPIQVSIRAVDAQQRVSLSILSVSTQMEVPRLQPNHPVWINVGQEHPLELVVDRVAGNRLDGHLVDRRNYKAEREASRLTFNASGKSL